MQIKKIIAIFDELRLKEVEAALLYHQVKGFSVQKMKGRGSYFNSYNRNGLTPHIQMEIYTNEVLAEKVAQLVIQAAHTNADDEGLVCIEPVEKLYWVHTIARFKR